jgi:hypothetical protein
MLNVHLFFLKLFGCMLAEEKANGYDIPIDIDPFSTAIMWGRPHAEVHLQFGRHDGVVGRSNLHCWKTDPGESVLAAWLYGCQISRRCSNLPACTYKTLTAIVSSSHSRTSSKRFQIADFMYAKRDDVELEKAGAVP